MEFFFTGVLKKQDFDNIYKAKERGLIRGIFKFFLNVKYI